MAINIQVVRVITVFTVFRLLTDFVCLYNYEFWLSLCKIVRSSVILLLPLLMVKKYGLEKTDRATSLKPRRRSHPFRLVWWALNSKICLNGHKHSSSVRSKGNNSNSKIYLNGHKHSSSVRSKGNNSNSKICLNGNNVRSKRNTSNSKKSV